MENLSNTDGLLIALSKTFENAKISDVLTDHSLKISIQEVTKTQFANLKTISELYGKEIAFKRLNNKISIEITEMEVENEN